MTKLYNKLAIDWYQLLTPLTEYKEEAGLYHQILERDLSHHRQPFLNLEVALVIMLIT